MQPTSIHAYFSQTPNGIKLSIALAELKLDYQKTIIDLTAQQQKEPWFLEINPNGRIPAMTDVDENGEEIKLFESGSILQYLVDRYDPERRISYPRGSKQAVEVNNWLFFQVASVGPMQGQANHFFRYAKEKIPYAIQRYQNEVRRIFNVLENHLARAKTDYLVGDKCTIADIAHWGWVASSGWQGVSLDDFPALKAWEERMWARDAVKEGANAPGPYVMKERLMDASKIEAYAEETSKWVLGRK